MVTVTLPETSRTTITMGVLPYVFDTVINDTSYVMPYCDQPLMAGGLDWTTTAGSAYVVTGGQIYTDSALTYTGTQYGTGPAIPSSGVSMFDQFNVWNGRLLYASFLSDPNPALYEFNYCNRPFATGALPGFTFEHSVGMPAGYTIVDLVAPGYALAWGAQPNSILAIACRGATTAGTQEWKGTLFDGTTTIAVSKIFTTLHLINLGYEMRWVCADAGAGQNTVLLTQDTAGDTPWWYCIASDAGVNLSENYIDFASADIQNMMMNFFWWSTHVDSEGFHFYFSRWEVDPPTNGVIIVTIPKAMTSYYVRYLTWDPGDAEAQSILDNANNKPNIVFNGTTPYYWDFNVGTFWSLLAPVSSGPGLIPPSVSITM